MKRRLSGHYWTLAPHLRHAMWNVIPRHREPWRCTVSDPLLGEIPLTGWTAPPTSPSGELLEADAGRGTSAEDTRAKEPRDHDLVVLLHGLGGSESSRYVLQYGAEFQRLGCAVLAFGMRGTGSEPADLYHSGLTKDLHAALGSPEVRRHKRVFLVGFSVGGHLSLSAACEGLPDNIQAITAVCPPIWLPPAREHIDSKPQRFYRSHVLRGLRGMMRRVAEKLDIPIEPILRARSVREFDAAAVVPRWGFRCPDHYAESVSVAPKLPGIQRPAMVIAADHDPMVPSDLIRKHLPKHPSIEARFVRGGHVWQPPSLDLGMGGKKGLAQQTLRWFRAQSA